MISRFSPSYHPHAKSQIRPSQQSFKTTSNNLKDQKYSTNQRIYSYRHSSNNGQRRTSKERQNYCTDERKECEERRKQCYGRKRGSNFAKIMIVQSIEPSKFEESSSKMVIKKKLDGDEKQSKNEERKLLTIQSIDSVKGKQSIKQFARTCSEKMKTTPSPQSFQGKNYNNFFFSPTKAATAKIGRTKNNSKFKCLEFYQNQIMKEKRNIEGILLNTKISLSAKPNERIKTEPMGITFASNFPRKKTGKLQAKMKLKKNPQEVLNNERIEGFFNEYSSGDEDFNF